ncbi:MAG TPA: glycosyltransferase family 39 protein [Xanthobacteraceae bacterium]|nr:glycosyltransferase family 39 protein [Xanthobacteraceae bacterium]
MISVLLSWVPPARIAVGINRWFDAVPSGRALWVFLALFVAIWTSFQIISYASIDLHFDLVEVFAWSQHLAPGYKHPPLAALVAAAWFSVFPIADWSFHLLAMVNAAVAFYAIDLIARRYVDGDKRLLVLLLLLLTPLYQFHGQRFSTNQVLLSAWPIATYCFLRSFESRTLAWSAAAGVAAAATILGKYYSALLVVAFVVAAFAHPRRFDYLRSPAPWVSAVVGLIVLAPHLHWHFTTGGAAMSYAAERNAYVTMPELLWALVPYVIGGIGYVSVLLVAYALMVQPGLRLLRETLWPSDPDRRMLVVLLAVPLLLPLIVSPLVWVKFTPLWTMPAWFLLPIVLLAPAQAVVSRLYAIRLAAVVLFISLVVLVASPAVAWVRFTQEQAKPRGHYAAVSQEVTRRWREATQRPLAIVSGNMDLGHAVTFYSPDHPLYSNYQRPGWTPWITAAERARNGWVAVCPDDEEQVCVSLMSRAGGPSAGAKLVTFDHAAEFFGRRGPSTRFYFMLVPPAR